MWDLIVSVPDHYLSFSFVAKWTWREESCFTPVASVSRRPNHSSFPVFEELVRIDLKKLAIHMYICI